MDGAQIVGATLANPWMYVAIVACGLVVFGIRALITGNLRTKDELDAMRARAETAEASLRVRDEQVNAALGVLPQIASVLEKFHLAGAQVQANRETSP